MSLLDDLRQVATVIEDVKVPAIPEIPKLVGTIVQYLEEGVKIFEPPAPPPESAAPESSPLAPSAETPAPAPKTVEELDAEIQALQIQRATAQQTQVEHEPGAKPAA